jgi:hypothetical protein
LGFRRPISQRAYDSLNRHNFLLRVNERYGNDERVARAFLRVWSVLVTQGHLVEKAEPGWFFVSEEAEHEQQRLRLVGEYCPGGDLTKPI